MTPTCTEPQPDAKATVNADVLLTAATAGTYLGLDGIVRHPAQAVRRLCRLGKIRSIRVAGHVMIRRSWLERYIESGGIREN